MPLCLSIKAGGECLIAFGCERFGDSAKKKQVVQSCFCIRKTPVNVDPASLDMILIPGHQSRRSREHQICCFGALAIAATQV